MPSVRHDLEGQRLRLPTSNEIYVVIDGQRCYIPDSTTYQQLFGSLPHTVYPALEDITRGPQVPFHSCLIKSSEWDRVFVLLDMKMRWITSPQVMVKYGFDHGQIFNVPQIILSCIPKGPDMTA